VPITRVPVTALNFRPGNIPFEYRTGYNLSQGFRRFLISEYRDTTSIVPLHISNYSNS
jgi:hypothetical protein